MTNTTTAPNLDIDNARDIVIHIYRALPDTADYFESGDCWAVENEGVRVFFGVDPHDGGGICWAAWRRTAGKRTGMPTALWAAGRSAIVRSPRPRSPRSSR